MIKIKSVFKVLRFLFELVMTLIIAGTISVYVLHEVWLNRGYFAFGGEWLLIICLFAFVFYIIHNPS